MNNKLRAILNRICAVLFPPRCIMCHRLLPEVTVCHTCRSALAEHAAVHVDAPPFVFEAYAPFYYEGAVRRAIIRLKFNRAAAYAAPLAELMRECLEEHLLGRFDLITWVPISKKRLRQRGYDQSLLIAKCLADWFSIPLVSTLTKVRDTPRQSTRNSASERRANVLGVYAPTNADFQQKNILLIDDVLTTGATISECARTLKCAGAGKIFVLTTAKTGKQKKRIENCAK